LTVCCRMPNRPAISFCLYFPDLHKAFTWMTCSAVSFEKWLLEPHTNLFLLMQSWILSFCVPRIRCSGLTHPRLSQTCLTTFPVGISPLNSKYEAMCAFTGL